MGQDFLQARREHIQNIVKSVSEDEFKDYAGFEAYQFMEARSHLASGKLLKPSLTWPALFLGPIWAGYRKMWPQIGFSLLAITAFGIYGLALFHLVLWLYGSSRYVQFVSKRISKLKAVEPDTQRIKTISTVNGGTSIAQAILAFFVVISFLGLQIGFMNGLPQLIETAKQKSALQRESRAPDPNHVDLAEVNIRKVNEEYAKANDIAPEDFSKVTTEGLLGEHFEAEGREYFVAVTATIYDRENACHACSPTIGFFSWRREVDGWTKMAEVYKLGEWSMGGFGASPETKWYGGKKAEFGIGTSYMAQGEVESGEDRFRIEDGKPIPQN